MKRLFAFLFVIFSIASVAFSASIQDLLDAQRDELFSSHIQERQSVICRQQVGPCLEDGDLCGGRYV